jgi:hypothetical protein
VKAFRLALLVGLAPVEAAFLAEFGPVRHAALGGAGPSLTPLVEVG